MGIFDRLGNLIQSYINSGPSAPGERPRGRAFTDPDLAAAMEELDDFLDGGRKGKRPEGADFSGEAKTTRPGAAASGGTKIPPEELRPDYAELGLPFGAPLEDCKAAYKKLLKIHHPDRHAGHAENMRKATAKSARINAAWDRIERWAR